MLTKILLGGLNHEGLKYSLKIKLACLSNFHIMYWKEDIKGKIFSNWHSVYTFVKALRKIFPYISDINRISCVGNLDKRIQAYSGRMVDD